MVDTIAEGRFSLSTAFMLFRFIMCYAFIQVGGPEGLAAAEGTWFQDVAASSSGRLCGLSCQMQLCMLVESIRFTGVLHDDVQYDRSKRA